jgi:hypothetical protein
VPLQAVEREMLLACDDESGEKKASDSENRDERMSENCPRYPAGSVNHDQPYALEHLS